MSNDWDNEDGQNGPVIWADQPELVVPSLRTFRVVLDDVLDELYVDAHSVTCEGDAAHFYVYRPTTTVEGPRLAAYAVRTLRPYLDVEDVTSILAATSTQIN